jgi:hypothetical protein
VLRDAPPGAEGSSTSALQLSDVMGSALGAGLGGALVAAGARADAPGWVGLAGVFAITLIAGSLGLLGSARLFTPRAAQRTSDVIREAA